MGYFVVCGWGEDVCLQAYIDICHSRRVYANGHWKQEHTDGLHQQPGLSSGYVFLLFLLCQRCITTDTLGGWTGAPAAIRYVDLWFRRFETADITDRHDVGKRDSGKEVSVSGS